MYLQQPLDLSPPFSQSPGKEYLQLTLGRGVGGPIKESAHRVVLVSTFGPPPVELVRVGGAHVLHICGNPDCLNPLHLVWGSDGDNKANNTEVYHALLANQGRTPQGWWA